jgi:hypothetical protein
MPFLMRRVRKPAQWNPSKLVALVQELADAGRWNLDSPPMGETRCCGSLRVQGFAQNVSISVWGERLGCRAKAAVRVPDLSLDEVLEQLFNFRGGYRTNFLTGYLTLGEHNECRNGNKCRMRGDVALIIDIEISPP